MKLALKQTLGFGLYLYSCYNYANWNKLGRNNLINFGSSRLNKMAARGCKASDWQIFKDNFSETTGAEIDRVVDLYVLY